MTGGRDPSARIGTLRSRIEALDVRIVDAVAERVRLAREIGTAKREAGGPTLDPEREAAVIRRAVEAARERGLPTEPIRDLFWTLLDLCRGEQLEDR